jgi:hypothetical protein
MASVEKLYCGAVKCSENDEVSVVRYCKDKKKQITKKQKVQIPQISQIDPKFLPGYNIKETGGNPRGYGCGFRTVYEKNKGWSGWGAPSAPSAPSSIAEKPVASLVSVEYTTPENLYCGTRGCSTTIDASIGKYCRGLLNNDVIGGPVRTPLASEISTDYLTGYKDTEGGTNCEFYRHYKKIDDWPGWKIKSSAVMNSLSKCCKTFDTLTAKEKTECGNVVKGTDACNKMFTEKVVYTPDVLYCGTLKCSESNDGSIRPWCSGLIDGRVVGAFNRVGPAENQISAAYLPGYQSEIFGGGRGACNNSTKYTKNPNHAVWYK